jgi:hypothetical protein
MKIRAVKKTACWNKRKVEMYKNRNGQNDPHDRKITKLLKKPQLQQSYLEVITTMQMR